MENFTHVVDVTKSTLANTIVNKPYQVDTRVLGSNETGITCIDEEGRGLFIPDVTEIPIPPKSKDVIDLPGSKSVGNKSSVSISELYPHWQENKVDTSIVIRLISKASDDLQIAVESSCSSELEIINYLVLAETQLFQALNRARFNKALETVISFCAWGLRNVDLSAKNSPSLQGMNSVLRELQDHPFITMDRATKLIMDLEEQGWSDESEISHAFDVGLSGFDQAQDGIFA
ncbi:MAG TPA: hypothetical protein VMV48_08530 [Gallionellaceae bacterium]|nr:hypothetical protein [Gallionellaceae bacterium]